MSDEPTPAPDEALTDEPALAGYYFQVADEESHLDAVERLADEVAMPLELTDAQRAALAAQTESVQVSRAIMTREEFVSSLLQAAGA